MLDVPSYSAQSESADQNMVYEGFAVRNRKAPFVPRLIAYLTDLSIVSALIYGVFILLVIFGAFGAVGIYTIFDSFTGGGETATSIMIIIMLCVLTLGLLSLYHGYFVYNEYKTGTTLGKRIFGLRVVSIDGGKLSVGQCVMRDLMRLIDCQLLLPGFLSVMLTKDGRRLGDMVAGTAVVYSAGKERENHFVFVDSEPYYYYLEVLQPAEIDLEAAKKVLEYAFQVHINGRTVAPVLAEHARYLVDHCITVPEGLALSPIDLELFLAEHCNQMMIAAKGKRP